MFFSNYIVFFKKNDGYSFKKDDFQEGSGIFEKKIIKMEISKK